MGQELDGKVAIVTGGANGIGRATVECMLAEGAKVVIADVAANSEAVAKELGKSARFKRTDVSKEQDIQDMVDFTVAEFGRLDILFNNAGISCNGKCRFLEDELKDFERVLSTNLYGTMIGSQRAARQMAKNGGGVIINNASMAAIRPAIGGQTYRASKAGVVQFSKAIAIDLAEYNIRVHCVLPAMIRPTVMTSSKGRDPSLAPEMAQRLDDVINAHLMKAMQPLKRQGRPRDVAELVMFLASDRALQLTGLVVPVDGGITIGDPVNHLAELQALRANVLAGNP